MKVTDELVDDLAKLAKLSFTGERKEKMKADFQRMLDFVGKLDEVDTDGVEPLIHMGDANCQLREDDAQNTLSHEDALRNAPDANSDYFKVPKVLNK